VVLGASVFSSSSLRTGGAAAAGFIHPISPLTSPHLTSPHALSLPRSLPSLLTSSSHTHRPTLPTQIQGHAIARRSTASPIRSPPHTPDRIPQVSALPPIGPGAPCSLASDDAAAAHAGILLLGFVPAAS
jgi:hypothetical protein